MKNGLNLATQGAVTTALQRPELTVQGITTGAANEAHRLVNDELKPMLTKAAGQGVTVNLGPARQMFSNAMKLAKKQGGGPVLNNIINTSKRLTETPEYTDPTTGIKFPSEPIPQNIGPDWARDLKMGIRGDVRNWIKEGSGTISDAEDYVEKSASNAIDQATDKALADAGFPGHSELNDRISNNIKVGSATEKGNNALGALGSNYVVYRAGEAGGLSPAAAALLTLTHGLLSMPKVGVPAAKLAANPKFWKNLRNITLGGSNSLLGPITISQQ